MSKLNKNTRSRSKAYSPMEIGEIMEIMRANDFNISKTSKQTNISRTTLTKFRNKYKASLAINGRVEHSTIQATEECSIIREAGLIEEGDFIQNLYAAKKLALNRIIELIPKELNLDRLVKALATLGTLNSKPEEEKQPEFLFQDINQRLIDMKKKRDEDSLSRG